MAAWIAWANDPVWGGRFHILLQAAKDLRDNDHPEAAIVAAQTAFEVCTEILISQALRNRGVDNQVVDVMESSIPTYNLGNDRTRRVYEAFTNDLGAADSARWSRLKQHVRKRDGVVHRGEAATRAEADASIALVEDVIEHMVRHYYDSQRIAERE